MAQGGQTVAIATALEDGRTVEAFYDYDGTHRVSSPAWNSAPQAS